MAPKGLPAQMLLYCAVHVIHAPAEGLERGVYAFRSSSYVSLLSSPFRWPRWNAHLSLTTWVDEEVQEGLLGIPLFGIPA